MSNDYKKSSDVPTEILAHRLYYLASVIAKPGVLNTSEFTMRIPAEVDRDADLVLAEASRRLVDLEQRLAAAESRNAELREALEESNSNTRYWGASSSLSTADYKRLEEDMAEIDAVLNKANAPGVANDQV